MKVILNEQIKQSGNHSFDFQAQLFYRFKKGSDDEAINILECIIPQARAFFAANACPGHFTSNFYCKRPNVYDFVT